MSDVQLTGRTRYRSFKRWFREPILVLQVEERFRYITVEGGCVDVEWQIHWRDATVQDMASFLS